jgi:hypothetical protein
VFVSLGLGSVIATIIGSAPWLATVSRYKTTIFVVVGVMLAANYWFAIARPRRMNCAPGEVCHVDSPTMRVTRMLFWTSVVIWASAVTLTYAAIWWVRLQ